MVSPRRCPSILPDPRDGVGGWTLGRQLVAVHVGKVRAALVALVARCHPDECFDVTVDVPVSRDAVRPRDGAGRSVGRPGLLPLGVSLARVV